MFKKTDLENIAQLACLSLSADNQTQLTENIRAIMSFTEQLRKINTIGVTPLFHPFDLHQRLRKDEISGQDCRQQLADIAPVFEGDLYLVPKVIDSEQ
jgi:aspartyl-tRNA(Asn)/glutamyl-tRNA(Gln) amidotransferase subunit C